MAIDLSSAVIDCKDKHVQITLQPGYPLPAAQRIALRQQIVEKIGNKITVTLAVQPRIAAHVARSDVKALPRIKNIIGIASGKGGVGKSTTAVNLALALSQAGAAVGLLDADIYGPNQPHLLGVQHKPEVTGDGLFIPPLSYGIESMSMGYLVTDDTPMVWRGPMISSALDQMLRKTNWSALDYLLVDLPPGTGDIPLTLAKKTPLSAVVMVTTPQDVALLDVRKAIAMFAKMQIPVLGVIENMAVHICQHCGHQEAIFGSGGGEQVAAKFGIDFLGKIPLALPIRESGDQGRPIVLDAHQPDMVVLYQQMATKMAALLAQQKKSYAHLFTNVAVENIRGQA